MTAYCSMSQDESQLVLVSLTEENGRWRAALSFRGKIYEMLLEAGSAGRFRSAAPSPFALTREGRDLYSLVERAIAGHPPATPCLVPATLQRGRLPSIHDPGWKDWTGAATLTDVWLESAEQSSPNRWRARLLLDAIEQPYELEILPGPTLREVQGPSNPAFEPFTYDLTRLLLRMQNGERFALPFRLRRRWPTPEDPPSL